MNTVLMAADALVASLLADLAALAAASQTLVAEMVVGPGGVPLIVLGLLGVGILAVDVVRLGVRLMRRLPGARGGAPACAASRTARARALAGAGATLPEIARRTGLARDALTLIVVGPADAASPVGAPPRLLDTAA